MRSARNSSSYCSGGRRRSFTPPSSAPCAAGRTSYSLTISVEAAGGAGWALPGGSPVLHPTAGFCSPSQLELVPPRQSAVPGVRLCPGHVREVYLGSPRRPPTDICHGGPPLSGGATLLAYVVVWEPMRTQVQGSCRSWSGGHGARMTDIENAISFTVKPNGSVSGAQYLWGGGTGGRLPGQPERSERGRQALCGNVVGASPGPAGHHWQ